MKEYSDIEFGILQVTKTIEVPETNPDTGEKIGTSIDDICKLPNNEYLVFREKTFDLLPTQRIQSRHFVLSEWIEKIISNETNMYTTKILGSEGEHNGNLYTSFSKLETGDYYVNTMENYFSYDKPYENKWFIKSEWINEIYELIKN